MKEKYIAAIEQQIALLDAKPFNLDAWKTSTINVLSKIFGQKDIKVSQVSDISFDFSSWTLRDTSGSMTAIEACKKRGKVVLEAAINELEMFGPPDLGQPSASVEVQSIVAAFTNELTGAQVKKIKSILADDKDAENQKKQLHDILSPLSADTKNNILIEILFSEPVKKTF